MSHRKPSTNFSLFKTQQPTLKQEPQLPITLQPFCRNSTASQSHVSFATIYCSLRTRPFTELSSCISLNSSKKLYKPTLLICPSHCAPIQQMCVCGGGGSFNSSASFLIIKASWKITKILLFFSPKKIIF